MKNQNTPGLDNLKPKFVLFDPPYTYCIFPDNTQVSVKCAEGEEYSKEVGVAECIIKKLYQKRNRFLKLIKNGFVKS